MKTIFALLAVVCSLSFALPLHAGEWEVKLEQSALGDNGPLEVKLLSQNTFSSYGKKEHGELRTTCRKGEINIFFYRPDGLFIYDDIEYKLDDGPISSDDKWESSGSLIHGADPVAFLSPLKGVSTLAVRFGAKAVDPVEMTFDVSGFDEVAKEITKQCGIDL